MSNREQIEYWDGAGGEHWVAQADRYDAINRPFGERVIEAIDGRDGERILDVGCGNGFLTLALGRIVGPSGAVTGVDLSSRMLDEARRRAKAEGLDNVTFEQGDAQVHPFEAGTHDAVMSRFGVMFFGDPAAAFANLARALRSGGRIAFACWRDLFENEWLMVPVGAALAHVPMPALGEPGGPGPFSLADPDRIRMLLGGAGFSDIDVAEARESMWMGPDVDDTVAFMKTTDMADILMKDVEPAVTDAAWASIREALTPHATAEGVILHGAAWIVTARKSG